MEEIQNKYPIKTFKEKTNKQKVIKFEEVDLSLYKPSARCVSFATSEQRILHWIRTFQLRYFESLDDSTDFLIEWIDHQSSDSPCFEKTEARTRRPWRQ